MKTLQIVSVIFIGSLLAACGGATGVEAKKAKLAELKTQLAAIKEQIGTLEKEIASADTSKGKNDKKFKDVGVLTVAPTEFKHFVEVQGMVDSDKNILVSAMASGTLTNVYVQPGQRVQKGQVLATIDADYMLKAIEEVNTQLQLATTLYEKQKYLWEKEKVGTEVQFLSAKTNKEALEKRKATLQEQYSSSNIKAPIDGVVDAVQFTKGETVIAGMPAFRIVGSGEYKVVARVAESYINKVKEGMPVRIEFPDQKDNTGKPAEINGTIAVVSESVDAVNRTFQIEVRLQGSGVIIKPNMIAIVKINDYSNKSAVVIPINAVQNSNEGDFVFLAKGDKQNGEAQKQAIKKGITYKGSVEISEGLNAGDQVVVVGHQDLVNKQAIRY